MRQQIPALAYQPGGGGTAFAANGMSAGAPAGPSDGWCSSIREAIRGPARTPARPRERRHRAVAGHARIRGTASVGESAAHACEAEQSNRAWDVSRFNSAWLSEADFRRVAARLLGRALVFGREETTRFRAVAGSHRIGRASHVRSLRQG